MTEQTPPTEIEKALANFDNSPERCRQDYHEQFAWGKVLADAYRAATKKADELAAQNANFRAELFAAVQYLESLGELEAHEPEMQIRESFRVALSLPASYSLRERDARIWEEAAKMIRQLGVIRLGLHEIADNVEAKALRQREGQ